MNIEKLGQNIKHYRNLKGLTQKELASKINKTESSVRKYERGLVDIPNRVISEIAEVLGVTINDLIQEPDKFKSEFNVDEFDPIAKDFILSLQRSLRNSQDTPLESGEKISVTAILQNLVIDFKARLMARKSVNLVPMSWPQLMQDQNGFLVTGEKLYNALFEHYKKECLKEKLEDLIKRFDFIKTLDEKELEKTREYYDDIPKENLPFNIIRTLYPDVFYADLRKDEKRKKFLKEMVDIAKKEALVKELDHQTVDLIREYYEVFRDNNPGILEKYL